MKGASSLKAVARLLRHATIAVGRMSQSKIQPMRLSEGGHHYYILMDTMIPYYVLACGVQAQRAVYCLPFLYVRAPVCCR